MPSRKLKTKQPYNVRYEPPRDVLRNLERGRKQYLAGRYIWNPIMRRMAVRPVGVATDA